MRLEISSNDSAVSFFEKEDIENTASKPISDEVLEMLRSGIKAAQSGNRAEARHLLLRVTEADPKNENAWLWLASISEYPEELLVFLNNVLDINPENKRALEWAKATKSLLAKTFVQRGIEADKENRRDLARQCFLQAVVHDSRNEMAWLWLASIADSREEKTAHLQRVLEINPKNEMALASLKSAKDQTTARSLLSKAKTAALEGDGESARSLLDEVLKKSPELESAWLLKSHLTASFREKAECFEKILEFNPASEIALANLDTLRSMMETEAPVEEQNVLSPVFESADEEYFSDCPTQELYLPPDSESEVKSAFEENGVDSESLDAMEVFPVAEEPDNCESFDFAAAEPEVESFQAEEERFFEAEAENPAEECIFGDAVNLYAEDFGETEPETVSMEAGIFGDFSIEDCPGSENGYSEDCYEIDANEAFSSDKMPENDYSEKFSEPERNFVEEKEEPQMELAEENSVETNEADSNPQREENFHPLTTAPAMCPFCEQENEAQAFICQVCSAMLTLSDLEMLLAHSGANRGIIQAAVEELEIEDVKRGLECDELVTLGIGHINLKDLRKGLSALQKAVKLNPNNVVLDSQVNALTIRLSEIEEKESAHDWMPKDRTIMVVDDSATVRKLISGKLEKCGHIVITAVDGMDAMEKLNDITPDLILLDIAMPRMDGYQVCKLIRNNESTKDIPIVMISGKDGFFDKVRGRMAGTTSYITKPFGPETLMKMLETYLV